MRSPDPGGHNPAPVVSVPEIRDYQRINAELIRLLDAGHPRVLLTGAEGQRLLAFGLRGDWRAVVEIRGHAGPELAAELQAPGLLIVCEGSAADAAGRGLKAGRLAIGGDVGVAVGYAQQGGSIVVAGSAGVRAGLDQAGGTLIVAGSVGHLAAERQAGGWFAVGGEIGRHPGVGRRGGRFFRLPDAGPEGLAALREEAEAFGTSWPGSLSVALLIR